MTEDQALGASVIRRVSWRLLPFLMLAYLIAYIDRVNLGFAGLEMNQAIGLSKTVFGFGGGIFFIGYLLFEVPSNLAMERYGASRWIARIMISWGFVSGAMALAVGPNSFLGLRFLLGAAEAGFFPGVILYLTYWFPAEQRARIIGIFMVAIPISSFVGSPISGLILGMNGVLGLAGWQWVFILEAAPAVLLGIMSLYWLTDRPEHAAWLTAEQRGWLAAKLDNERLRASRVPPLSVWKTIFNKHVLILALIYAGNSNASSTLSVWQPQIIKGFGLNNLDTSLVNAIPFGIASVVMILWGRNSDKTGERIWHSAIALAAIVLGLVATLATSTLLPTLALLTLAVCGTYAAKGPFWALSTEWLSGPAKAAGIAQINALGNFAAFGGISLLGLIKDSTDSYALASLPTAALAAVAMVVMLAVGRGQQRTTAIASSA